MCKGKLFVTNASEKKTRQRDESATRNPEETSRAEENETNSRVMKQEKERKRVCDTMRKRTKKEKNGS